VNGEPVDPADAFAELGRIKLGETDIEGVLHQVAALAKRTVPGAGEVSVTLRRETRWPDLAKRALDAGCRSSLSIGLPVRERVTGALNIYATEPDAFDEDAVTLAQTFAGYAAVAVANAYLYDTTATLAQHMQKAMESRAVIEQAKGIIMAERRCTADEAFQMLTKVSQDANRKLRDVAAALVDRAAGASGS
jgi:transcriptional regulator with GAF, ATPase, and Fis domain